MKNENPIRNSLLPRNSNFVSKKINMKEKEKEIEKNKDKINRSQRVNSNHFVYCSKYSNVRNTSINKEKENNISNKANDLIDEEGLDHPNPLISDSEENLEELKAQFITKGDKYESLTNKSKRKKSKDIKNLADSSTYLNITPGQGTDSKQLPTEAVESNRIDGNNTPIKFNILYKKNENELALNKINQNRPKTQKIIKNHKQINKSLNNKININYNITNKDNNNNKKENDFKVNKYIFLSKQENNKSSHDIKREREEFNQILSYMDKKEKHNFNYFNEYNRKKPVINSYNYLNYGDENGREKLYRFNTINNKLNDKLNKLNKLNIQKQVYKACENKITQNNSINNIKEGLLKNKSNKHVYNQINSDEKENINNNIFNNSKKEQLINRIKSGYPQKRKIIQNEYENEKNISKILWTETDIKTKSYIDNQYIIKNKCRNNNQINIDSKDLSTNNESQTIGIDKEKKLRKLNSYKFPKNKNILNTMLNRSNNLPILNSNELKTPTLKKKHVIFSKHKDGNENVSKYRLKSFEKDDNFNNIQTTFIVISKNSRRKPLQKSKMPSEVQNLSRCKLPIPSVSYKNYSKCLKRKINLYSEYTLDIKDRRNIGNGHKDSGITKSVNNISMKHNNYRNELSSDKNIHHPNYKNYFDYPNITGNRRALYSYSNRRISRLINKSK